MTNDETYPKPECRKLSVMRSPVSSFGLRHSFGFRLPSFGFENYSLSNSTVGQRTGESGQEWIGLSKGGSMRFELGALAAIIVLLNLPLLHGACAVDMIFLPGRVAAGEWWRIFTHAFVHVSWYHLLLDATAFLVLYEGLAGRSGFERMGYVLACGTGSLLASLWSAPIIQTHGLCGLSGIAQVSGAILASRTTTTRCSVSKFSSPAVA